MKRLVVLTGAGMSAESGIPTFRGADGLWEGHRIEEVATPQAWAADFRKVLRFYNERRVGVINATPNRGHIVLKELEEVVDVRIITQNIDDLHERAGSSKVMHLHGEIRKARSTKDSRLVYDVSGTHINEGDVCELGSQLRPHIVWFHEDVPMMEPAIALTQTADIFLIVGTSLQVYPAASLVHFVGAGVPVFVVDPVIPNIPGIDRSRCIEEGGSAGLERFRALLMHDYL